MSTQQHWAAELIGKPWRFGAQGPEDFDCWGLARYVQAQHYGIEMHALGYGYEEWKLAALAIDRAEERQHWQEVTTPADGDLVLMGRSKLPLHIGIWIRANKTFGVLHCLDRVGVMFSTDGALRLMGWRHLVFFRHNSKCTT